MRLVATWSRWAPCAGVLGFAFVAAVEAYHAVRGGPGLGSYAGLVAAFVVVESVVVQLVLRSEEARLARELRTARTGTAVARGLVVQRRARAPFFARIFSTRLGTAAVLVAQADREGALEILAASSPLMRGGRLDALEAIVDADLERATGTSVGLERSVERLREMPPLGHREADLYRIHVLVKAILEQGDAEGAEELARKLEESGDEDRGVYAAWLRVWFELDEEEGEPPWAPLGEGRLRLATLLARAHGAEKLVEMLDARVASVARPERQ